MKEIFSKPHPPCSKELLAVIAAGEGGSFFQAGPTSRFPMLQQPTSDPGT